MGLMSWFFRRVSNTVFSKVDYNGDNKLEPHEVELAVLKVYNIVNKRLPGWEDPPEPKEIRKALALYDVDKNGALDKDEFYEFARVMIHVGPDAFFSRVGKDAVMKGGIVPGATHLVRSYAGANKIKGVEKVPLAVLAPMMGSVLGGLKGILPI